MTYTLAVRLVTLLDVIFIVLLAISGSVSGLIGDLIYYVAFILPITVGFFCSSELKRKREEIAGVAEKPDRLLTFDRNALRKTVPLVAPAVATVFAVSFLTSMLMSVFGVQSPPVEKTDIVTMLIVHALTPAIFEEALFRYIPMKLLMPYSKRWCVIYSAFCFALIHCSFPQMPYAFIAGVIFMVIDIAFGSVWPSVILHFLNNTTSVISMKYCTDIPSMLIFFGIMMLICTVSLFFTYKRKEEYKHLISGALDKGDSFAVGYAPFALALICCCVALTSI